MKRVLLDENLDRRLKIYFSDHFEVVAVPDLGWQSKKNGELLAAMADEGFDYLLTADQNLRFQQNLTNLPVKLVILLTHDIRRKFIANQMEKIESKLLGWDERSGFLEIDLRQSS